MAKRNIIQIDDEKCDGCGQCVPACAEGALKIVQGKARMVSETYCDGLGACLGKCPRGAITVVEREAAEFDEAAVKRHLTTSSPRGKNSFPVPAVLLNTLVQGCPGAAARSLTPEFPVAESTPGLTTLSPAQLRNWPVQLHLAPTQAPYFHQARLLLAADCVPFAYPDFHRRLLAGKILLIACPKLDNTAVYREKLAQIISLNALRSIDIAFMEVPCCGGLIQLVNEALAVTGKNLPVKRIRVGIQGRLIPE